MIEVWDNKSEAAQCVNTKRPLTRSLDSTEEGLAMEATRTCSIADCDRARLSLGWCKAHYSRYRRHGDPLGGREMPTATICTVEGCERRPYGNGLCKLHWQRFRRTGETERQPFTPRQCSIDNCGRTVLARGWCGMHWQRWRSNGDPLAVRPNPAMLPGEQNSKWRHDMVGYQAAHDRVKRERGSASDFPCTDCGKPALQWAYDHLDPDERVEPDDPKRKPYSVKPEHYRPLCLECHWRLDHPSGRRTRA